MANISPTDRLILNDLVDFPFSGIVKLRKSRECGGFPSQGLMLGYSDGFPTEVALSGCGRIQSLTSTPLEIPPVVAPCHYEISLVCGGTNFHLSLSSCSEDCCGDDFDPQFIWDGSSEFIFSSFTKYERAWITPEVVRLKDEKIISLEKENNRLVQELELLKSKRNKIKIC